MSQYDHLKCMIYFAKAILPNETIKDINDFRDLKFFFKIIKNKEKVTIDNLCNTLNDYFELAIHTSFTVHDGFIDIQDLFKILFLCIMRYILTNAGDESKSKLRNLAKKIPEKYHDKIVAMIEPALDQYTNYETPLTIYDIELYLNFGNEENLFNNSILNASNKSISDASKMNQSFYHTLNDKERRELSTFTQYISSPEFRSKVILRKYPESVQKEMYQKILSEKINLEQENFELGNDIYDKEKNISQLSKQNISYEKEATRLKSIIKDLKEQLDERDERISNMVDKSKVKKLEDKLIKFKSLQNDNELYLKKISDLKCDNENLTRKLKDMAELRKLCFRYQEDLETIKSKYIIANQENSSLHQKLLDSQNREIDLNDMIKELQNIVKPIDTSFQDSFILAQQQSLMAPTEGEVMSLVVDKQKQELEEKFNELIISTIPIREHEEKIRSLNSKIESLTNDAKIAQDMQHKFQNLSLSAVQSKGNNQYFPDILFDNYTKLQQDVAQHTQNLTQLQSDIHSICYLFNIEYNETTTFDLLSRINHEIMNLQKEKSQLSDGFQFVYSEISELKKDIKSNIQSVQQFIESVKEEVSTFYMNNRRYLQTLSSNRDVLEELSKYYKKRCKDLKQEFIETNTDLQSVISETQQLNKNISGYITELSKLMQAKEAVIEEMQNSIKEKSQHELQMLMKVKYLTFQNNENTQKIVEFNTNLETANQKIADITAELNEAYQNYNKSRELVKQKEFHVSTLIQQQKDLDVHIEVIQKQKSNLTHENEDLKRDFITLNDKLTETEKDLSVYKNNYDITSQNFISKELEISKLKELKENDELVKEKLKLEISELQDKIEYFNKETINKTQNEINDAQEKYQQDVMNLNHKLTETEALVSEYKKQYDLACECSSSKEKEIILLKQKYADENSEKRRMECVISDLKSSLCQKQQIEMDIQEKTKHDNIGLNQQLTQMQADLSFYKNKYEMISKELSEITEEKIAYKNDIQKLKLENLSFQSQIDTLTNECLQKQQNIDEKAVELKETSEKLHAMSDKLLLLEKNIEKEILTLNQSSVRQKERQNEVMTWRDKFYSINQQYNLLNTNYQLERTNYQDTLMKVEDERDKFSIQLEQKQEDFKILLEEKDQQIANIKSDLFETRRSTLIRRQELESNLDRLEKSVKSKENYYEGLRKGFEENVYQEREEKLKYKELYEQEIHQVNTKWKKELDKTKLDLDDKVQRVEHLETELRNIIGEMYKTEDINSKLKSNEHKLEEKIKNLTEELKTFEVNRVDHRDLEKQVRLMTMRLDGKNTELNSRLTEIKELEDRLELTDKKVARQLGKISELDGKLTEAKEESIKLKRERVNVKEEIDQYKEQITLLNEKEKRQLINKMKLEKSFKDRISSLEDDMKNLRCKYDDRNRQMEELQTESSAKDKVIMSLQAKFSKYPEENYRTCYTSRYRDDQSNSLRPQSRGKSESASMSTTTSSNAAKTNAFPCEDEPSCLINDKTPFESLKTNKQPSTSSKEPSSVHFKIPLPTKDKKLSQTTLKRRDGFRKVGEKIRMAFRNKEDKNKKIHQNKSSKEALLTKICTSPTSIIHTTTDNSPLHRERIDKMLENLDASKLNNSIITDLDDTLRQSKNNELDCSDVSSVDSLFVDSDTDVNKAAVNKTKPKEGFAKNVQLQQPPQQAHNSINVVPDTPLQRNPLHQFVKHITAHKNPSTTSNSTNYVPSTSSNSTNNHPNTHIKRNHRQTTIQIPDGISSSTNVTTNTDDTSSLTDLSTSVSSSFAQPLPPKTPKTNRLIFKMFKNSSKPKIKNRKYK